MVWHVFIPSDMYGPNFSKVIYQFKLPVTILKQNIYLKESEGLSSSDILILTNHMVLGKPLNLLDHIFLPVEWG